MMVRKNHSFDFEIIQVLGTIHNRIQP